MTKKTLAFAAIVGLVGYLGGMTHCALETLESFDKYHDESHKKMDELTDEWRTIKSNFKETFKRK